MATHAGLQHLNAAEDWPANAEEIVRQHAQREWVVVAEHSKVADVFTLTEIKTAWARDEMHSWITEVFTITGRLFHSETYVEVEDIKGACATYRVDRHAHRREITFTPVLPSADGIGYESEDDA